jgi:hypothetical protein
VLDIINSVSFVPTGKVSKAFLSKYENIKTRVYKFENYTIKLETHKKVFCLYFNLNSTRGICCLKITLLLLSSLCSVGMSEEVQYLQVISSQRTRELFFSFL